LIWRQLRAAVIEGQRHNAEEGFSLAEKKNRETTTMMMMMMLTKRFLQTLTWRL